MSKPEELTRREGFWSASANKTKLPFPIESDTAWKGKKHFLTCLSGIQGKLGMRRYKGSSKCRLCGQLNGSGDYRFKGWVWPEGFAHYVKAHNVRPSLAFQEMAIGETVSSD